MCKQQDTPCYLFVCSDSCHVAVPALNLLQNISNLVWAYGRLSYPHPQLFSALAAAAKGCSLDGFNNQNLTDLAWGCAATDFEVSFVVSRCVVLVGWRRYFDSFCAFC
jgi:hypothetical protein